MHKWILAGVLALAFLLRVPYLDKVPAGFTADEASFGYDAYSILNTGKDQWGKTLPLVLESFGDFKPPLYAYLAIPTVFIFDLTKFATRLPNALLGVAAVYVIYLLVRELLGYGRPAGKAGLGDVGYKETIRYALTRNEITALTASFLLAISPWHVMLSRGAFEANLTTLFMPLGAYLYLASFKNHKFIVAASFVFGLNLFSYHSPRLVTPLLIFALLFLFRKETLKIPRHYLFKASGVFLISILLVGFSLTQGAGRRFEDVGIFRGALEAQADARLEAIEGGMSPALARILNNKFIVTGERFADHYKQYFSLRFLFREGAGESTYGMVPGIGALYWFELPLLAGFLFLLVKNKKARLLQFVLFWILISPVPAALTMGVGYAGNRAAVMMPAIQIASALGAIFWLSLLKKLLGDVKVPKVFWFGFALIGIAFFLSFAKNYFLKSSEVLARGMLHGNLETAHWLRENTEIKGRVVVSRALSEPHIYIAFANSWDPKLYHAQTVDWRRYQEEGHTFLDQLHRYSLGKYVFMRIEDEHLLAGKTTLLVGRPDEFPDGVNVMAEILYPDGEPAILIIEPYGDVYAGQVY